MRKRERENPCGVCGHYHKYEQGEVCGICGHRTPVPSDKAPSLQFSAFPSEILPDFLYLGSYDNASRGELLKTLGISRVLNTVPSSQNLYKNSFTYYCLQDDKSLPFDDAIQILEQCKRENARVLVHCMTGKNRSPTFVIAYLMKSKGWRLPQSHQWVKDRNPSIGLTPAYYEQLQEYERKVFVSVESSSCVMPPAAFGFGFPKINNNMILSSPFNDGSTSILANPLNVPSPDFTFGALLTQTHHISKPNSNVDDIPMDGPSTL